MANLRAFVGHSFLEKDRALVQSFLSYLTTLSESKLEFEWEHALPAQTEEIAKKVLNLIEDKNVFIGICTRHELAAPISGLNRNLFSRERIVRESHLAFKTSDWLIQEIGLAVGRNMRLILLQEEGVRIPGGLQGNVEYISFSRDQPERAFPQLLQMLTSLTPPSHAQTAREEVRGESKTQGEDLVGADKEYSAPDTSWNLVDFEVHFILSVIRGDISRALEIQNAYPDINKGAEDVVLARWEAFCAMTKLRHGVGGKLSEIKSAHVSHPADADIASYLASAYNQYDETAEAIKYLRIAVESETNSAKKIAYLKRIAQAEQSLDGKNSGEAITEEMRHQISGEASEAEFLSSVSDLQENLSYWHIGASALERLLQLRPDDHGVRFKLAYFYSEHGNSALAAFHYGKIPESERTAIVWNNLGVAFQGLNLPSLSVECYSAAIQRDETLAMSNLAEIYLKEGLLGLAEDLVGRAEKVEDCHDNIANLRVKLNSIVPGEMERRDKVLADNVGVRRFLMLAGQSLSQVSPPEIGGCWVGDNWTLSVVVEGGLVTGEGEEEAFANALGDAGQSEKRRYSLSFAGRIEGGVVHGTRSRKLKGNRGLGLIALGATDQNFTMVFDEDNDLLRCMCGGQVFELKRAA